MAAINFTKEELDQLELTANSFMKVRAKLTEKDWRKGEHKTVRIFYNKFAKGDPEKTYILSRNELRLIEELCRASIQAIDNNIVPSYTKRIEEQPDKAAFYQGYVDKCVAAKAHYNSIHAKVEGAL